MGAGDCLQDWQESPGKTEAETAENNSSSSGWPGPKAGNLLNKLWFSHLLQLWSHSLCPNDSFRYLSLCLLTITPCNVF